MALSHGGKEKISEIFFYNKSDLPRTVYSLQEMKTKIDSNEIIDEVWKYKTPLTKFQLTDLIFHHRYTVFKTKTFFWSVEKVKAAIVIQRSPNMNDVVSWTCNNVERNKNVSILDSGKGSVTVGHLIRFIQTNNLIGIHKCADKVYEEIKHGSMVTNGDD